MKRTAIVAAAAAAVLAPVAAVDAKKKPRTTSEEKVASYALPGTDVFPEGVAVAGKTFYVTSTTDGTVFRGNTRTGKVSVFLPGGEDGRTTAVGTKVAGDLLLVAGGSTGYVFAYDRSTGELVTRFVTGGRFINDLAVAHDGTVYVTDSQTAGLFRITPERLRQGGDVVLTPFAQQPGFGPGFNANGIVAGEDALVYVQSSTGKLFRLDYASEEITEVAVSGTGPLTDGDGLVLKGNRLYVVRNAQELIVELELSSDFTRATFVEQATSKAFQFPTTAALVGGSSRLLVVNSQFDERGGDPVEPFTVVAVKRP